MVPRPKLTTKFRCYIHHVKRNLKTVLVGRTNKTFLITKVMLGIIQNVHNGKNYHVNTPVRDLIRPSTLIQRIRQTEMSNSRATVLTKYISSFHTLFCINLHRLNNSLYTLVIKILSNQLNKDKK